MKAPRPQRWVASQGVGHVQTVDRLDAAPICKVRADGQAQSLRRPHISHQYTLLRHFESSTVDHPGNMFATVSGQPFETP
jgi:hypothetical protein